MVEREAVERQRDAARAPGPLEAADAGAGVEAVALTHAFDGVRQRGQAPGVGAQHGDGRHDVDEPGDVTDQLGRQLRARREVPEAHLARHVGRQRGEVGQHPARQEVVDVLEHHHPAAPDVLPVPGAVHGGVETAVDAPLRALAAGGGHLRHPAQHGAQLAAPGPVRALPLELDALEHAADEPGHAGDRRDVEQDQQHRQDRRAVGPGREVQPADPLGARQAAGGLGGAQHRAVERLDRLRALHEGLDDEEDRGDRPPEPHGEPDHPAVEPARALVDALVDGVGQARLAAALGAVARQVEGDALVGEHLGVEAPHEPAARPPVQGGREHVPQRHAAGARDEDREIGEAGRRQHLRRIGDAPVMELRQRREEVRARGCGPDAGLAQQRRHREQHDRERPGLPPALGDPVGRDEAPEGAHALHVPASTPPREIAPRRLARPGRLAT